MPASHGLSLSHHHHASAFPHGGPLTRHDKLVKNAQKLVSQTFFGTMLKQMHNSPFKSKIFSGGRGGEAFGSLLDQHLADRMASGAAGNLVDSIVKKWDHPPPVKGGPAAVKQRAPQSILKRSGYRQTPPVQWSQYVPADIRA